MIDRYLDYLAACNRRDWPAVGHHVADEVRVNGVVRRRDEYIRGIQETVETFPDYQWSLVRGLVDGEWLAVHLVGRGTRMRPFNGAPGDGSHVDTDEFDMYRFVAGSIVELEGTADNLRLCR